MLVVKERGRKGGRFAGFSWSNNTHPKKSSKTSPVFFRGGRGHSMWLSASSCLPAVDGRLSLTRLLPPDHRGFLITVGVQWMSGGSLWGEAPMAKSPASPRTPWLACLRWPFTAQRSPS